MEGIGRKLARADIHIHPFFGSYSLSTLIDKAMERNVKILGLEEYNNNIFPALIKGLGGLPRGYNAENDSLLLKISKNDNSIYLPKCTEITTKEKIHLLIMGDYNGIMPNCFIEKAADHALERGCFVMLDHPGVDSEKTHRPITNRTRKCLEKVIEKYKNKIFIEKNGYCREDIWKILSGACHLKDILLSYDNKRGMNESANEFAEELAKAYNIKMVADTDLHARKISSLDYIAASNIEISEEKLNFSSGKELINSIKQAVNDGEYKNNTSYPSIKHILFDYVIPNFFASFFHRPRG